MIKNPEVFYFIFGVKIKISEKWIFWTKILFWHSVYDRKIKNAQAMQLSTFRLLTKMTSGILRFLHLACTIHDVTYVTHLDTEVTWPKIFCYAKVFFFSRSYVNGLSKYENVQKEARNGRLCEEIYPECPHSIVDYSPFKRK